MSNVELLKEIEKGTKLRKTTTNDKSAPLIEKNVQIKKNPRPMLMEEIKQDRCLKHVQPIDKSAPVIENIQCRKSCRPQLMEEIRAKFSC